MTVFSPIKIYQIFWKTPLPPSFVYPEEWGSRFP